MEDIHPAELLFQAGLARVGASCGTFYVRDPHWTHELRLVFMPGVRVREPMYGFLIPRVAREVVTSGPDEQYFQHGIDTLSEGTGKDAEDIGGFSEDSQLFGNFAQRENVTSSARFIYQSDGQVQAVMFANFSTPAIRFDPWLRAELRDLFRSMVRCLPSIYRNLRNAHPFPITDLLAILQPFERLTAMFHGATSPSLETYLESVLSAALDVCGIDRSTGFGTVHLLDPGTRCLHLHTSTGSVSEHALLASKIVPIDRRKGLVSWAAIKRRALLVQDLHLTSSPFRRIHIQVRPDTRVELAVPMTASDELIGVFNLESAQPFPNRSPFDLVRIVWYAANQAAIACRLATQADIATRKAIEARRNAEVSAALLRICSDAPTLGAQPYPLNEVARIASKFLRADRCDVWEYLRQPDSFRGVGSDYEESHLYDPPRSKGEGWSHYVHSVGSPVWITQICDQNNFRALLWSRNQGQWLPPPTDQPPPTSINNRLVTQEIGSELGIPIRLGQNSLGVAWIKYGDRDRQEPTADEIRLADGFAGEAALVMACLMKQELQGATSQSEGIEVIVKTLRHDMPDRFLGQLIDQIRRANELADFTSQKPHWLSLLTLLKTFIENLRLYTPLNAKAEFPVVPKGERERVRLGEVVNDVVSLAGAIRARPKCVNEIGNDIFVVVERTLAMLSIFALLDNAKRFTPTERKSEQIILSATEDDAGNVLLTIDDCGFGISDDVLQLIGTRVGVRQSPPGITLSGMGFGAYLARRLMLAQMGDVRWEKREPHGTRVTILLPKTDQ